MMQPILETERLILRAFTISDAERVAALANDKRIAQMTSGLPYPYKVSDALAWIDTHQSTFVSGKGIVYAVILKESSELIGTVSLPKLEAGQGLLGYWLGVAFWGYGYTLEACQGLIAYAKQHLGLTQLQIMHLVGNEQSKSVILKLGATYIENQLVRMRGVEREVCVYLG